MPFTYSPTLFLQLFVYIPKYVIKSWFPESMFHFNKQIIEHIFSNWKHFFQKSGFVPYVYSNKVWIVQSWKGNLHQGWIQLLMHTCSFFPTVLIHTCSFSLHLPHSVFINRLGAPVPNRPCSPKKCQPCSAMSTGAVQSIYLLFCAITLE